MDQYYCMRDPKTNRRVNITNHNHTSPMSEELTMLHVFTDAWFLQTRAFSESRQQQKHNKSEGHLERLNL